MCALHFFKINQETCNISLMLNQLKIFCSLAFLIWFHNIPIEIFRATIGPVILKISYKIYNIMEIRMISNTEGLFYSLSMAIYQNTGIPCRKFPFFKPNLNCIKAITLIISYKKRDQINFFF